MEELESIFKILLEKHGPNTQIQSIITEIKEQIGKVLYGKHTCQSGGKPLVTEQLLKFHAHHCIRPEVINNLSHKVKTPLTAIISGIQLLYNYDHDDNVLRILDYLMQSSIELTQFVNDIMDLYYITQDKFDIEHESVNLVELLEYVYSVYALQMQEEQINFNYDIDKRIPEMVLTDKKRLTQIMINIFSNSIKSFDFGQDNKQIAISIVYHTADKIQIHVRDTGKGVDLQKAENLFNPFYKTDNSEGVGLGLTICRMLLKKIGNGTIKFITPSVDGYSTELMIELDIMYSKKGHRRQSIIKARIVKEPVLVLIDDNTTNLDLLKIIIKNCVEKNKFRVDIKTFNDPITAKTYINANLDNIVLCLVDFKMPRLNGIELIESIYADNGGSNNNVPFSFVIVSALTRSYIMDSIAMLPDFMKENITISSKPYNIADLEKHIVSALKGKALRISAV